MSILDNTKFILTVCELYYLQNFSQKEISAKLGISRPQISRIIATAQERKLVNIHLNYPNEEENEYQNLIKEKYGVNEVYVYDLGEENPDGIVKLAEKSSDLFSIVVKDGERVGVMAGRTVSSLADAVPNSKNRKLEFIPLCGGAASDGNKWYANAIAQRFAEKTNSHYYVYNAPQIVRNEQSKKVLLEEPNIKEIVNLGHNCDVCLIGIGSIGTASTGSKAGQLNEKDINHLLNTGAVANMCASYLDAEGNLINTDINNRILGVSLRDIEKARKVVVATGIEKVSAILAALKGKYIDVLITSLNTAKGIIKEGEKNEKNNHNSDCNRSTNCSDFRTGR